uniref:Uncharacterized protein n=1 Tax=Plectus sambesii TaxID=2011161 RepID=A0A914XA77_9BILA
MLFSAELLLVLFVAAMHSVNCQDRPRSIAGLTRKFILLKSQKHSRDNLKASYSAKANEAQGGSSSTVLDAAAVRTNHSSKAAKESGQLAFVTLAPSTDDESSAQPAVSNSAAVLPGTSEDAGNPAPAALQPTLFPPISTLVPLHPSIAALFGLPTAEGSPAVAPNAAQLGAAPTSLAAPSAAAPVAVPFPSQFAAPVATPNDAPVPAAGVVPFASTDSASVPASLPLQQPVAASSFELLTLAPFVFPTFAPAGQPLPASGGNGNDLSFGYPRVPGQEFDGVAVPLPDGNVFYVYCHNCQGK